MKKTVKNILYLLAVLVLATGVYASTTQTEPPTTCSGDWNSCSNAFANGGGFASILFGSGIWEDFGFSIPASATITDVTVRTDLWQNETGETSVAVQVSDDGGTTWGPKHFITLTTSEQTYYVDFTNDFNWTPGSLNNDLVVKVSSKAIPAPQPQVRLDYIAAKVSYDLS